MDIVANKIMNDDDYYMITMRGMENIYLATSAEAVDKAQELCESNPGKTINVWSVELYDAYNTDNISKKMET